MCYASHIQRPEDKFASRSRKCIFVGYPFGKKGWKVYDLEAGNIFVSHDVIFNEDVYPFAQVKSVEKGGESNFGRKENLYVEDDFDDCAFGQINMPNFTTFGEVSEPHQESGSATPGRTFNVGSPMRNDSSSLQAQFSPPITDPGSLPAQSRPVMMSPQCQIEKNGHAKVQLTCKIIFAILHPRLTPLQKLHLHFLRSPQVNLIP